MAKRKELLNPGEIESIRERTLRAVAPLTSALHNKQYRVGDRRTHAGRALPPYYLVYFLLVDLLRFPSSGRWEKVDWTIPVDLDGNLALIEHRKMGLGIFSPATEEDEEIAKRIVTLVGKGIAAAKPYFEHLALQAVERSELNITNNSRWLFERYEFLRGQYSAKLAEANERDGEIIKERREHPHGGFSVLHSRPAFALNKEAQWIAISAIEAFFSWTEHVFIHLGILRGELRTGQQVGELATAEWLEKFKLAVPLNSPEANEQYMGMLAIRRQIRNFIAHGAFGKDGEAFHFHSAAGAVPVRLLERGAGYSMFGTPTFNEAEAFLRIDAFLAFLWSDAREAAKIHIQDHQLPSILPFASDGTYAAAMLSTDAMESFTEHISRMMDDAANMDW